MLCDVCHKNEATIHIQEIRGNQRKTIHLCYRCAAQRTEESLGGMPMDLSEMLMKFTEAAAAGQQPDQPPAPGKPEIKDSIPNDGKVLFCPSCGWDLASFRKTGKLGCPDCYGTFESYITPMLPELHRGVEHRGRCPEGVKEPKPSKKPVRRTKKSMKEELARLQHDLDGAVQSERYEDAALLRDRITALQNEIGRPANGR